MGQPRRPAGAGAELCRHADRAPRHHRPPGGAGVSRPWLVVIDPQRIFADPDSDWGSPMWADAVASHQRAPAAVRGPDDRHALGAARGVRAWDLGRLHEGLAVRRPSGVGPVLRPRRRPVDAADARVVDAPTFGKWDVLAPDRGEAAELVVTGVSTDCCVISTVLPGADAGATITVVTDACAGSTPDAAARAGQGPAPSAAKVWVGDPGRRRGPAGRRTAPGRAGPVQQPADRAVQLHPGHVRGLDAARSSSCSCSCSATSCSASPTAA